MITSVTYARLYALPGYENERFEATASVENGDAQTAWNEARTCVELQYAEWRIVHQKPARPAPTALPISASDKQRNYIATLQDELGWTSEQLAIYANEQLIDLVSMSKAQASAIIEHMKRELGVKSGLLPF